ncbi:AfsR/SARP family transcriptional regulator [Catellatospora bangladeshensis]|uniref:OmpR/PhoB-type domain-containing protein n=1 Tax=Catellatospora bangladeshensis TaxID=310355 RepID=A0A8J3JZF3_9ACTN|nr:BTAD domain-containing putative transcriptional regulator [Catellatospora bangladeshensis]GIF85809.1 hypothetical protein Cba03nite_71580 [Catellatospora bangladeshensis]
MHGAITYAVLGPFQVRRNGHEVDIGHIRQQAILAILVLAENRRLTADELLRAAWGEDAPPSGAKIIPPYIYRLRRALNAGPINPEDPAAGTRILRLRDGYQLRVDPEAVDLTEMTALVDRAREARQADDLVRARDLFATALSRWHGEPLSALPGPYLAAYRTRLLETRLGVLEERIGVDLSLGRHLEATAELSGLVVDNPLRESLVGLLMLALYRSGRQAEALKLFHATQEALREELGIDPGPELRTLHTDVLRADPGLDAPSPPPSAEIAEPARARAAVPVAEPPALAAHVAPVPAPARTAPPLFPRPRRDLPRDLVDFVGRHREIMTLAGEAFDPGASGSARPIAVVSGMAGVGKTSLALHAAHLVAGCYSDGQIYLDLRGHTTGREPKTPAEALENLLGAVGVGAEQIPPGLEDRAALWRSHVAGRRLLLVLDNVLSAPQVRPILPGSPMCRVLMTSRHDLTGLDSSLRVWLSGFDVGEGLALLERVLGADRVAAEPDAARRLVELCDGLPLAIRICAVRLRKRPHWPISRVVNRMQFEDRRLAELSTHDQRLTTAFAASFDRLPAPEQRMFVRLAVLSSEFDTVAAARAGHVTAAEAEQSLEYLLDANLLVQQRADMFHMPPLLRGYARTLATGFGREHLNVRASPLNASHRSLPAEARSRVR